MNSKDFIISKMKKLVRDFKTLKTSYSFHELSDTHSIEVVPSEFYYQNDEFKKWEIDFVMEFINLFPNESICLLTDDSLMPIENIEFTITGKEFEKKKFIDYISDYMLETSVFDDNFYETFQSIFNTHSLDFKDEFSFTQKLVDINSLPSVFNDDFKLSRKVLHRSAPLIQKEKNNVKTEIPEQEECIDNYSLAA